MIVKFFEAERVPSLAYTDAEPRMDPAGNVVEKVPSHATLIVCEPFSVLPT
jgi:hypothetical protein